MKYLPWIITALLIGVAGYVAFKWFKEHQTPAAPAPLATTNNSPIAPNTATPITHGTASQTTVPRPAPGNGGAVNPTPMQPRSI